MTKEEAIKNIKEHCYFANLNPKAKKALDFAVKTLEQQPCEDAISRQAVLNEINRVGVKGFETYNDYSQLYDFVDTLSSATPQPKIGRWIYDDIANNWRCDKCGETPKTMGYVGTDKFMAEHFKFCNHCGAKMESEGV